MDRERISSYLHSLETEQNNVINDIEVFAGEHNIPIAKKDTVSFLQIVTKIKKPLRILEVGTAIGYSAILMTMSAGEGCETVSIEKKEENYRLAIANIERAKKEGLLDGKKISLILGDAAKELQRLDGEFDLIFMDAAKAQYVVWLPLIKRLLSDGAVLFSDNVFQDETIFESKFAIERRDRTIHKRMRQYLYELTHSSCFVTSILPVGDGVALSIYNKGKSDE